MKIVVIIPTYNEKSNITKMIPLLLENVFPKIKKHQMCILIADDNSPDGTSEVVEKFKKKYQNIELLLGRKEGLGAAYVRAMKYAMDKMKADAIVEFDADFQHDPYDIPRLIQAMDDGADHVIGSRYIKGGQIPTEWGMHRKFMSFFGSMYARLIWLKFHVHDMTSGYKLTKTSVLRQVDLDNLLSKYYAYKMHILHDILKLNVKVVEVPIIFYERKEGSSKIEKKDLFDSFFVVTKLRIFDSKRLIKFLFVGGTGFLLQIFVQEASIRLGFAFFLANFVSFIANHFIGHIDVSTFGQSIGTGLGAESAILSNFFFNNYWTFSDTKGMKERSHPWVRLFKFNSTSLFAIFIQSAAVWTGIKLLGDHVYLLSHSIPTRIVIVIPTIIFIVIPLNYLIYNRLIWKTQYLNHEKNTRE